MKKTLSPAAAPVDKFSAPELRFVTISEITPDPKQPRKHFDPKEDADLMQSILTQGILQPLLIRPMEISESFQSKGLNGAKFLLVCGERRYQAARALWMDDTQKGTGMVPVIIRSLNDEEALEAQIVENLQRKDVHPMEEALAFQMLAKKGLTQEQIGARVGKGDRFVRGRLVLCNLAKAWQDLFSRHAIDLETALKISRFPEKLQAEILKDQNYSKEELASPDLKIDVRDFAKYRGDLNAACFSKTDPTLNPKMGPCEGCQFNSATGNLFPSDTERPRCSFLPCYQIKVDKTFKTLLAQAKDDPTMVLVKAGYRALDSQVSKELKSHGLQVLDYDEYHEAADRWTEDPGSWEDYVESCREDQEIPIKSDYDRMLERWNKKVKEQQKGLASGRFKKALVVDGDNDHARGTLMIVELKTKAGGKVDSNGNKKLTPAQKVAAGKATISDITAEISRLEKDVDTTKAKILDNAHLDYVATYKKDPFTLDKPEYKLHSTERACLVFLLLEELGGVDRLSYREGDLEDPSDTTARIAKAIGIQPLTKKGGYGRAGDLDLGDEKTREATWKFLQGITDEQLALIIRRVMCEKYGGVTTLPGGYNSAEAYIMRAMVEAWDAHVIAAAEAEAAEKGNKRIERAKARIKELKEQKAAIEAKKASKATAKPSTAKPAAKGKAAKK